MEITKMQHKNSHQRLLFNVYFIIFYYLYSCIPYKQAGTYIQGTSCSSIISCWISNSCSTVFYFLPKKRRIRKRFFSTGCFFYSFLFNNDYSVICPLSAGSEENGRMDDLANVFFWGHFMFLLYFYVPVYEEIVFRGCFFNSL